MAAHNELGKWGEEMAAEYLQQKGYRIIERDWRSGARDIDIIAQAPDPSTLVFVEVKTRKSEALMRAADAVNLPRPATLPSQPTTMSRCAALTHCCASTSSQSWALTPKI